MKKNNLLKTSLAVILTMGSGLVIANEEGTWSDLQVMTNIPAEAGKQVTSQNWVWYPYNRWSFQNLDKVLPSTEMNTNTPLALDYGEVKPILNIPIERAAGNIATIGEVLASHNTDAFMVLHEGKVVKEKYWNGMEPNSTHWIASMTKSFTGLAAEMLIEQGVIERNQKAEHYVVELKGTAIGSATIQELMDMTAGTAWDESMSALEDETSFARQYGNAAGTWPMGKPSNGVFGILPKIEMDRPHGEKFEYNSPQTDAIGWVISAATGERLEDVISELFFGKMGSQDRAFMMADTNTYAWATGGINMSARDAAKFGQMMADKGTVNGEQVFSESVYNRITTGDASKFAGTPYDARIPGGAYSSFFWLTNDSDGSFMAKGMFSQYIYVNPTKNVVIVRFASPEISSMPEYDIDMLKVFGSISKHLS